MPGGDHVSRTDDLRFNPDVSLHPLGDEAVLLVGRTGKTLLLSPTAALICRGIQAGFSVREVADHMARSSSVSAETIVSDAGRLLDELGRAGAIGEAELPASESAGVASAPFGLRLRSSGEATGSERTRSYRIGDFAFLLQTPDTTIDRLVASLFGHLSATAPAGETSSRVGIVPADGAWQLVRDGRVIDQCGALTGVLPMLHAHTLMMAYHASDCLAGVHAAVVTRGDACVLMPAVSGSGKTTLTAALLAAGAGYLTDDLALLEGDPLRVRGLGTCLGLKRGAWDVLGSRFPEIRALPVHTRADEVDVRYLPPPARAIAPPHDTSCRVKSIIFPSFSAGTESDLRSLSPGEGLMRLTEAGYDLPQKLDRTSLSVLVDWISDIPCFGLLYGCLDDAVSIVLRELG